MFKTQEAAKKNQRKDRAEASIQNVATIPSDRQTQKDVEKHYE
jgi:hypothetical protein